MAARVVYLALGGDSAASTTPGVLPGNVLCLTFTNKATENLQLRVRRALASLELAEGEEPEIMNYHGFAAPLLERHGMLAGIEPGAARPDQAQREELCGRVLDRDDVRAHVKADVAALARRARSSSSTTRLQNHRVTPGADRDLRSTKRLDALKSHRSDRAYKAAQERIELARGRGGLPTS